MSKYTINSNQNLYALLRLLDTDEANEITLKFSAESDVYKNSLNLKTLKKLAEARGKTLKFEVENPAHEDYINSVNGDYIEYNDEEVNLEDSAVVVGGGVPFFSKIKNVFGRSKAEKEAYVPIEDNEEQLVEEEASTTYDPEEKRKPTGKQKLIKAGIIAAVIILFLGTSAWAFFWYVPTAVVKITVDTKGLIKLVNVKASTSQGEVSVTDMAIPAISVETSETDSQKIPTTGKKTVGDPAKGKINITNKTDKKVTIDKGTAVKLISSDKDSLMYKTTDKVEINPYSETIVPPATTPTKSYESKEVGIEAISFGDNYNLKDTEKFKVGDHDTDDIVAENLDDISGGSSKEVNVVGQADLDTLKRTTEEFMKDKVQKGLAQKLVAGQVMQQSSVEFNVTTATYSNQLDEEADEVTLEMTMSGKVLAYDSSSLDTLMKEVVKTVVPDTFDLNEDNPEYEVAATSVSNGTDVNLQVKLTSSITPKLDDTKIKDDLSGMSVDQAKSYLDEINDVKGFEISISPNLPGVFLRMPQRAQNISIEVNK